MPATASIYRQPNALLKSTAPLLALFVFLFYSAVMEVLPFIGKIRPQLILAGLGLLVVFGSGQFIKVINDPIGRCFAGLTVWFVACVPFGAWPGGSFSVFMDQWYKAVLIYLLIAGLLTTIPQAFGLFRVSAYAAGLLGTLTLLKNNRAVDGRLILDNTRYLNSNNLAWTLLVGLTFIGFLFAKGTRAQKAIALLMIPPVLLTISRTGSRAGLLGVFVLFVLLLRHAKPKTRVLVLVLSPVLVAAVIALIPKNTLLRYTTFFGTYNPYELSSAEKVRIGTIQSSETRQQLLIDSLVMTAKHPFLGVGPGNFQVVQNEMALARGETGAWRVTHNTYTQFSSEMGLPGLILFLAMLYYIFKTLNAIVRNKNRSKEWQDLASLALYLRTAMFLSLPILFFDALAYNADVPILAGLTTAIGFMAQKQRAIDRRAAAEAAVQTMKPEDSMLEPVPVGTY